MIFKSSPAGPTPPPPEGYRLLDPKEDEWLQTDLVYDDLMEIWRPPTELIHYFATSMNIWPKYPPARKIEDK
jgi:hypothetical protein